jgi:N-succinyl-L-ornithine transcarbamylase
VMNSFVQYAGVPIISLESATLHPLQSLTDILTIKESIDNKSLELVAGLLYNSTVDNKDKVNSSNNSPEQSPDLLSGGDGGNSPSKDGETIRPKIVLTWAPHVKPLPQCVANSFAQWVNAWGQADFVITHPEDYELSDQYTRGATITTNQNEALKNADFVYVKNWRTYNEYGKIYSNDPAWMLTEEKLKLTSNAKVMHCLPVRRNVELSDEILDSENSLVTKQAGNRVWAAQAVISQILKGL